ncbi:hypothetical protein [Ktedonospora formicarum]|nr:hypothetical protein [Ktedonospora formicarum]
MLEEVAHLAEEARCVLQEEPFRVNEGAPAWIWWPAGNEGKRWLVR